MSTERRWLGSILKAAEEPGIAMPWARGARREEMIARRTETKEPEALSA